MQMEICFMNKSLYKTENIETLIQTAQDGDIKALEELLRRIQKNIFTMFSYLTDKREDIADLTQIVLLKTAKSITTLKEAKYFKSWLNHIITNTFYDFTRKNGSKDKVELNNDKIMEIKDKIGCEPGEKCLFAEMDKLIRAALLGLPEPLRVVIILREYEGLSYEDISKVTNTTIGTVKSRISRARFKLQQELKEFI